PSSDRGVGDGSTAHRGLAARPHGPLSRGSATDGRLHRAVRQRRVLPPVEPRRNRPRATPAHALGARPRQRCAKTPASAGVPLARPWARIPALPRRPSRRRPGGVGTLESAWRWAGGASLVERALLLGSPPPGRLLPASPPPAPEPAQQG